MDSQNKDVFAIPNGMCVDGVNLHRGTDPSGLEEIRMKRGDVVLIATYPRTGTTWLCQIVSLLLAGESEYEQAKATRLVERVTFAEYIEDGEEKQGIHRIDQVPKPCILKTHMPYRFIQKWIDEDKVKTIVTTRNPKDTLVSLFHFYKTLTRIGFSGTWDEFFEHVKAKRQLNGVQLDWYMDWKKQTDNPDILFIKYEEIKGDLDGVIRQIVKFLDLSVSETLIQRVIIDSNIKSMASDSNTNLVGYADITPGQVFIRKGEIRAWKKYFTVEQNEWFDHTYKEAYMKCQLDVDYN